MAVGVGSWLVLGTGLLFWMHAVHLVSTASPPARTPSLRRPLPEPPAGQVMRPDGTYARRRSWRPEQRSLFLLASEAVNVFHPSSGSQYFQDEAVWRLVFENHQPVRGTFVEFG